MRTNARDSEYHPVLILWPDSENWPCDGEIDYAEGTSDVTKIARLPPLLLQQPADLGDPDRGHRAVSTTTPHRSTPDADRRALRRCREWSRTSNPTAAPFPSAGPSRATTEQHRRRGHHR